eukprot:SAG11_NODE_8680_length_987_cov_16.354730_1_plen_104_part_00
MVSTDKIVDGAITSNKIAAGAVTSNKIAAGVIPTITGTGNISVSNNVVSLNSSPSISGILYASTIGAILNSLVTNIHAATIYATSLFVTTIGSSTSSAVTLSP